MNLMVLGKLGSGKTTASKYLIDNFGFERAMMAHALKKMAELSYCPEREYELLHFIKDVCKASKLNRANIKKMYEHLMELNDKYGAKKKRFFGIMKPKDKKDRVFLQELGTQFWQTYNKNIWVNYTYNFLIKDMMKNGVNVIIDDIRFKHEFDFFNKIGFSAIRICTTENNRKIRVLKRDGSFDKSRLTHLSETDLDEYGEDKGIVEISNNESYTNLITNLSNLMNSNGIKLKEIKC